MARTNTTQRKALKGTVAAVAGVAILLGGFGTWANWYASDTLGGRGVTVGTGTLSVQFNDPPGTWGYGEASLEPSAVVVPGDVLKRVDTGVITATGDNIAFTVSSSFQPQVSGYGLPDGMSLKTSIEISDTGSSKDTHNPNPGDEIYLTEGVYNIKVVTELDYDFGEGANEGMGKWYDLNGYLNDVTVSVTQTETAT